MTGSKGLNQTPRSEQPWIGWGYQLCSSGVSIFGKAVPSKDPGEEQGIDFISLKCLYPGSRCFYNMAAHTKYLNLTKNTQTKIPRKSNHKLPNPNQAIQVNIKCPQTNNNKILPPLTIHNLHKTPWRRAGAIFVANQRWHSMSRQEVPEPRNLSGKCPG